jgi:RNA polymerase sigma-70 factor (ECF subfamily)
MAQPDPNSVSFEFVSLLTEHQGDLWAFILSLMPGHPDAKDVLQKTNLVLWEKREVFLSGTNFRAWAITCARFTVLDHLKRQKNRRIQLLDDELIAVIASEAQEQISTADRRLEALENCLARMRPQDRELLDYRYRTGGGLEDYARHVGRSVSALSVTLHRLRTALRRCVQTRLSKEANPT